MTRVLKILGISPAAQQALPGCPVTSWILALQLPHLNTPNNLEFVTNPNLQTVLDRSCTAWSCCRAAPSPELRGSPGSLVQVGPVIGALDVDPPHALDALPLLVLLQVVGAPCSPSRGFQEGIVRPPPILGFVQKNVQGLLINSGLWELHLAAKEEKVTHCRHQVTSVWIPDTRYYSSLTAPQPQKSFQAQSCLFHFLLPAFESNYKLGFYQNQADLSWEREECREGVPLLDPPLHRGVEPSNGLG